MPNIKSQFLMVQKLWPRLKDFFGRRDTDRQSQTGQKLNALEFHSWGIHIYIVSFKNRNLVVYVNNICPI